MQKTLDLFQEQIKGLTGSVSQGLIETIKVRYLGNLYPIREIGVVREANNGWTVSVFDEKIVSELLTSTKKYGFNSFVSSKKVVFIPQQSESAEEKEKVKKYINSLAEQSKVSLRNIRRDAKKQIEKLPETEKNLKNLEKITAEYIAKIDRILKS